jgi:hypothetical protein
VSYNPWSLKSRSCSFFIKLFPVVQARLLAEAKDFSPAIRNKDFNEGIQRVFLGDSSVETVVS